MSDGGEEKLPASHVGGRGRGLGTSEVLRRPGKVTPAETAAATSDKEDGLEASVFRKIADEIAKISLDDDDSEDEAMDAAKALAIQVKESCDTADKLTEMMHFLHSESLCSESFATKTAFVFGCLSQLEVDGVKCRAVYLRKIQTEFTAASVSSCQYHNLIVLLCQVFRRVRIADGTTISALCSPILQGLKALLDEEDEEAALVFSQQVQIVGPELARLQPDKFAELLLRLREKLFQGTCTRRARASLLAVLELSLNPDWRLNGNNVRELFEKESVSLPQPMEISRPPILSPPSEPHSHRHHQQPHKQSSPKGPSLFRNMPPTSNASPPSCGRIGDGFTRRTHWSSPPSSTSTTTTTTTSDSHQWGQISPSCYGGVSWIGKDTQENKNKTSFRIGTWTAEEERRKDENVPERQQLSSRTTDDEDDCGCVEDKPYQ